MMIRIVGRDNDHAMPDQLGYEGVSSVSVLALAPCYADQKQPFGVL